MQRDQQFILIVLFVVTVFGTSPPLPVVPHALVNNAYNCTYSWFNDGPMSQFSTIISFNNETFPTCPESVMSTSNDIQYYRICAKGVPPRYFNTLTVDGNILVEDEFRQPGAYLYHTFHVDTTTGPSNVTLTVRNLNPYSFPNLYCFDNPSIGTTSSVPNGDPCYFGPQVLWASVYCKYQYSFCYLYNSCVMSGLIQEVKYYPMGHMLPSVFGPATMSFTML